MMKSQEVREKFLQFFEGKGHKRAPSSSLVPMDPSVLFTTAGMQQFKPYYLGEKSPWGDKVTSVQKCMRTSDIEEVGDDTHCTFFEMLGNFAFNNAVSKHEVIEWAHEFITKEMGLTISHIAVFAGNKDIPADTESEEIWKSLDATLDIRKTGADETFWGPTGEEGPCGPTTEIYVNEVEIWNIVFNEYYKDKNGQFKKLENFGIDTGMGLERLLVAVQEKKNIFETDLFEDSIKKINELYSISDNKIKRIIADHTKASTFMLADGIIPSNTGAGYILRRLLRRSIKYAYQFRQEGRTQSLDSVAVEIRKIYPSYFEESTWEKIRSAIIKEENNFLETLERGLKEFEKGTDPFILATTYGFPIELTEELAREKGIGIDRAEFNQKMKEHQKLSQTSSAGMFKGGLSDASDPQVVKLHTAHHLLLAALQEVLGKDVKQRGSNITPERLRMDFSFDRKMTDEEKKKVEDIVNEKIQQSLPVIRKEMPRSEAEKLGAQMEFGVKYPEMVSVYFVGNENQPFSVEFCGGPHVNNTSELGTFKLQKEEASAQGVRRIKGVLQ